MAMSILFPFQIFCTKSTTPTFSKSVHRVQCHTPCVFFDTSTFSSPVHRARCHTPSFPFRHGKPQSAESNTRNTTRQDHRANFLQVCPSRRIGHADFLHRGNPTRSQESLMLPPKLGRLSAVHNGQPERVGNGRWRLAGQVQRIALARARRILHV